MLLNDQIESPMMVSPTTPPSPKPAPDFSEKCPVCGRAIQSADEIPAHQLLRPVESCKNCENFAQNTTIRRGSKISREQIRARVISEIISSEKTFVNQLNDVIQVGFVVSNMSLT